MIEIRNVSKTFYTKDHVVEALNNVSFCVEKGEIFGIIGLSGAGKSTLIRSLNLLEKPDSGQVLIDGVNLLELNDAELRKLRKKIGMIFQSYNLLMQATVLDNVCFPMKLVGIDTKTRTAKAMEYLEIVGLADKAKAYPSQLSGGQKQRVAIARVLATNPEILLCDEATSALDPETTKSILKLIKQISEQYNITVVLITHEMSVIQEVCNRCVVLEKGQIAEENTVEELFANPKSSAAKRLIFNTVSTNSSVTGRVIRVAFDETNSFEPIIANMILEFKSPVSILESNIQSINGVAKGQMLIQLPDDKRLASKMIKYLKQHKTQIIDEVVTC